MILLLAGSQAPAPPPPAGITVALRNPGAGRFAVALIDAPRFEIVLRDNGISRFRVAFRGVITLDFVLSASAELETPVMGEVTEMDIGVISAAAALSFSFTEAPFVPALIGSVAVGAGPFGITTDGVDVYVANYGAATVSRISGETRQVIATIALPEGSGPTDLAFDGEALWVTLALARRIARVSLATNEVVALLPTDSFPHALTFDGADLWATENTRGAEGFLEVTVFNPAPGGGESAPAVLTISGVDPSPLPS